MIIVKSTSLYNRQAPIEVFGLIGFECDYELAKSPRPAQLEIRIGGLSQIFNLAEVADTRSFVRQNLFRFCIATRLLENGTHEMTLISHGDEGNITQTQFEFSVNNHGALAEQVRGALKASGLSPI